MIVILTFLNIFDFPSCITHLPFKNPAILLNYSGNQSRLADSRWTNYNQWLALKWCWIKRMVVLLSEYKDIILQIRIRKLLACAAVKKKGSR